jgi:hypothetical protein
LDNCSEAIVCLFLFSSCSITTNGCKPITDRSFLHLITPLFNHKDHVVALAPHPEKIFVLLLRWNSWMHNFHWDVWEKSCDFSDLRFLYLHFCLSTKCYSWTNLSILYWLILLHRFLKPWYGVVWFSVRFSSLLCTSNYSFYGEKMYLQSTYK